MFETAEELAELQRLLDFSFERVGEHLGSIYDARKRLSASQLSGFQGVRLVAVATVNSNGEPRAAPRSAAFLHGRFYLAANSNSVMVRRLATRPSMGLTYFENQMLIIGHGSATPFLNGDSRFKALRQEWEKAFKGSTDGKHGINMFIRVDAENMVAFAKHPERYPAAWKGGRVAAGRRRRSNST